MSLQTNHHRHRPSLAGGSFSQTIARVVAATMTIALWMLGFNPPSALGLSGSKHIGRKVALVTGANKGIGYEIVRKLVSHKDDDNGGGFVCLLGCRNKALGDAAAESLRDEFRANHDSVDDNQDENSSGLPMIDVVEIDLLDHETIDRAVAHIETTYGRCDVLINNAAVCYNDPTLYGTVPRTPFAQQAEITIATNFFGTLTLTRAMLPLLLRENRNSSGSPRIINIASSAGRLSIIPSEAKRAALSSESLSLDDLGSYMERFVAAAKEGKHQEEGWPNTGYGVSKVGIIAMAKILAREQSGSIRVHSVDPGYCATDQNNNQGVIPAERGAVTPYLLATLDVDATGKHWYQEREIAW